MTGSISRSFDYPAASDNAFFGAIRCLAVTQDRGRQRCAVAENRKCARQGGHRHRELPGPVTAEAHDRETIHAVPSTVRATGAANRSGAAGNNHQRYSKPKARVGGYAEHGHAPTRSMLRATRTGSWNPAFPALELRSIYELATPGGSPLCEQIAVQKVGVRDDGRHRCDGARRSAKAAGRTSRISEEAHNTALGSGVGLDLHAGFANA